MSWLSYLNPLNWPKDLSKSFISQLENGLLYLLALLLDALLTILNDITSIFTSSFEGAVGAIISSSESLGPFGLPAFIIGMVSLLMSAYLVFSIAKDIPVVGTFA